MNTDTLLYKIALTLIPNVGPRTAKQLIAYCGGVEAVFKTSKRQLLKIPRIGPKLIENININNVLDKARQELDYICKHNIKPLFFLDETYPSRLKHINDSPLMLYFKGNANLNQERTVAIIGTRSPTQKGIWACQEIIKQFQPYSPVIISGLAYGIDITAHKKSLTEHIPTIGVVGHGLNTIYPHRHKSVAEKMIENGGILSEYPSYTLPDGRHFPMRNRIIAGLADAVLVIETAEKGGSIITANLANSYHKDVFALPGNIFNKYSKGCNLLIKHHKASLFEHAEDVAQMMNWEIKKSRKNIQKELFVDLNEEEKNIVDLLRKHVEIDIDGLSHLARKKTSQLASLLLNLEFKGILKPLPGKRYVLI